MIELGLTLNAEKTKIVDLRYGKEGFDFLRFHHRQKKSWRYKKRYTLKFPKKNAVKKVMQRIKAITSNRKLLKLSMPEIIKQ